jgi:hypothetical protein
MKKIKFIYFAFALFLMSACADEEAVRIPEFGTGPNVRFQWNPDFGFINFDELETTFVRYSFFSESTDLDVVELLTIRNSADTVVISSYTQSDIVANNGVIENEDISAVELADAFEITLADFQGGDTFEFVNRTTMADGTVYPSPTIQGNSNVGPSITGGSATQSFTSTYTAYVGCPSNDEFITGTYIATIVTENSAGNPPFGLPNTSELEVEITAAGPEPFRYTISQHDAGWWARPDVTATEAGPGDFYDICGSTIVQPIGSFGFGGAAHFDGGAGSIDFETGVITLNWYNSFNDIFGFLTLTPVED